MITAKEFLENHSDYNGFEHPDIKNNDVKLCYFHADIDYSFEKDEFIINDKSEPFECSVKYRDCTERGYCDGSC